MALDRGIPICLGKDFHGDIIYLPVHALTSPLVPRSFAFCDVIAQ
jgi:hypothetical protein